MFENKKKTPRKKTGLPPGSVIFTGNQKVDLIFIHHLQYNTERYAEKTYDTHKDIPFHQSPGNQIDWYDVRGLHDTELIKLLGETFQIHNLALEDIVDTNQRPKFEEYRKGNFVIIRALVFDKSTITVKTEQVALYFRTGLLFSFQETDSDLFQAVRGRIKGASGKIRQRGSDYLCYALLDNIVDNYYVVLDEIGEVIELIEDKLLEEPDSSLKEQMHQLKKVLLTIRKSILPLREAIGKFSRSDSELIDESSLFFMRDLHDHTVQVMDMVETFRDLLNSLQDLYLSQISFKMNQVMQVLTLIATIFIPLTFLVGVYGMNFKNIPELETQYGYYILWIIMIVITIILIFVFRKRKWL